MNDLNKSLISAAEQYVVNLFSQKIGKDFIQTRRGHGYVID